MNEIAELKALLKELSKKDKKFLFEAWQECIKQGYLHLFPSICAKSYENEALTIDDYKEYIMDKSENIEDRYAKYWRMMGEYSNDKDFDKEHKIEDMYRCLFLETLERYDLSELQQNKSSLDRVFIFVNQYLMNNFHAPSILVNRLIEGLKSHVDNIVIISSTPYPFPYPDRNFLGYNYSGIVENRIYKIEDHVELIELRGYLDESKFFEFILSNEFSNDDKYILVGDSSLHFDILPFDKKIVLPTTVKNINLNNANYILTTLMGDMYNISNNKMELIETTNDYTLKSMKFTPKEIIKNKDINIAIVGNRLDFELDEKFMKNLANIKEEIPRVKFLVIGDFKERQIVPESLEESIVYVGFVEDLLSYLFENVDFYLNPDRVGGGQSAVISLKAAVPVITLNKGDVFYAIKEKYYINDFSEASLFINKYANDKEYKKSIDKINENIVLDYKQKFDTSMEKILAI